MQRLIPVPRRLLPSVLQYLTPDEGQLRECLECHHLLPDHRIYYPYLEELQHFGAENIFLYTRRNYTLIWPCTRRPGQPGSNVFYCHICWDRWHRMRPLIRS